MIYDTKDDKDPKLCLVSHILSGVKEGHVVLTDKVRYTSALAIVRLTNVRYNLIGQLYSGVPPAGLLAQGPGVAHDAYADVRSNDG